MEDKVQQLEAQNKELKAEIYDSLKTAENLNKLLSEIVQASGIDTEKGINPQDLIDRVTFLASLEEDSE